MYQSGKHGAAIGFLKEGCALGVKALILRRGAGAGSAIVACGGEEDEDQADKKVEEGWKQLEEGMYRRWELLGVCYSKIGDRKVSHLPGVSWEGG